MINNSYIKYRNHFKLHVLFKDTIVFESELIRNNITFYNEEIQVRSSITYFLLDKDREAINKILVDTTIVASTDTIAITDYSDANKVYRLYFYIAGTVVIVMILLMILD